MPGFYGRIQINSSPRRDTRRSINRTHAMSLDRPLAFYATGIARTIFTKTYIKRLVPAKSRTHRRFGFYFRFFRIDRHRLRRLIAAVKARLDFEREKEREGVKIPSTKIFYAVFFLFFFVFLFFFFVRLACTTHVTNGVNWFRAPSFFSSSLFQLSGAMCARWCVSIS